MDELEGQMGLIEDEVEFGESLLLPERNDLDVVVSLFLYLVNEGGNQHYL